MHILDFGPTFMKNETDNILWVWLISMKELLKIGKKTESPSMPAFIEGA